MARPKRADAPVATATTAPDGFTPVEYVFRRARHEDALYGTRIVWDGPGDVKLVPSTVAAKMLALHPDVYQPGAYVGQAPPEAKAAVPNDDEGRRIELEVTIQTMDKVALESYARTHFGQELDRRRAVETLRRDVILLIDQFGAP